MMTTYKITLHVSVRMLRQVIIQSGVICRPIHGMKHRQSPRLVINNVPPIQPQKAVHKTLISACQPMGNIVMRLDVSH